MANIIYLKLEGKQQGLISRGCCTSDSIGNKYQSGKEDYIFITEFDCAVTRDQNLSHHPIDFVKLIDKSSPLILVAIANNEKLTLTFDFFRTSQHGGLEKYYTIRLNEASIVNYATRSPNNILRNDILPEEYISVKYRDITASHIMAGTSGYSITDDNNY